MKPFNERSRLWVVFITIILLLPTAGRAVAEMLAEQITPTNAKDYLLDYPDRQGGIGDWYLSNGIVWAIVDDVSNQNQLSLSGGTLIDIGLAESNGEQLIQILQLLNMTRDLIIPYDQVRADRGDDWASITVSTTHGLRPERPGFGVLDKEHAEKVNVETEYRVSAGEHFLRIKTTVRNDDNRKARIFFLGDIIYWGDDSIKPFAGSEKRFGRARGAPRGFHHPLMDPDSLRSIMRAMGGFTYVAGGGVHGLPAVSYGLCSPEEYGKEKLLWGVNDRMVSAVGVYAGRFRRPFDLWKIFFFGIPPGKELVYERLMVVGNQNDVSSATDIMFRLLNKTNDRTGIVGKIDPSQADTSILILTEGRGIPITQIRPDRTGIFKALLPPGDYRAEIRSVECDPDLSTPELEPIVKTFKVERDSFADIGTIQLPKLPTLILEVFEGEQRSPARVIICGSSGTPDPELGSDLLDFTLAGVPTATPYGANWLSLDGNEIEPVRVILRPGIYTLYATRGFEYSVDKADIDLSQPGKVAKVRLSLEKVIDTPGLLSGDFHVHSAASPDTAFSQEQRVRSFVAEGVDLLIATDHDMLTDYSPIISRLNLSDRLMSIVGVEATTIQRCKITPFTIGHYNSWPLRYEPSLPRRGMVMDEELRPRDLYDRLKSIADGESLIQVNHGREGEVGEESSFFNALGLDFEHPSAYDPSRPISDSPNDPLLIKNSNGTRDIDFDAMELLNGHDYREYLLQRADWFSLLNQGYVKTATANSDTHIKANLGGYPRNYIILSDPNAERGPEKILVEHIRRQQVFGTTGPIISFDVNGEGGPGEIIAVQGASAILNIKVSAAAWVPLDEVRLYANGRRIETFKTGPQSEVVRFDRSVTVPLEEDTWFVVEATMTDPQESQLPAPPGGLYNIIAPDFVPIAFTNPVFVDTDGNGHFDPPGVLAVPKDRR